MDEESQSTDALLTRSGNPSEDLSRGWLYETSPRFRGVTSSDLTGKWCIFVPRGDVDAAWEKIKDALKSDQLWCAKVSTALRRMSRDNHVICVYTANWTDTQDLLQVRDVLRALGFVKELGYKRDVDTRRKLYGPGEWYLRA
jgi:hypothetical protein